MDGIGKIILEEREKAGISQEKLTRGICKSATLSKLEWNEQNISKWKIDALLQRLGRSQDNFWTIVHIGDYNLMEQRRKIWRQILNGDYENAETVIKEYKGAKNGENFHEQFRLKCLGMLRARKEQDKAAALELFRKSILLTVPEFEEKGIEELVIGRDEMEIILYMAEAYVSLKEENKARILLEGLLKNIQKKEWDEEELVKIYPKVVRNYIPFLKKEDSYEEVISLSKKAIEMLVDNGIIFLLSELMESVMWGLKRRTEEEERRFSIREEQEYTQLGKYIEVLNELWETYGDFPKEDMVYYTNVQKDISVSNEIIAKCRKLCKLSQEKLSEDVCTAEQLSRIETGKCSPTEKSYRALMEKMNQAQERNRFFINAQEYSIHEKVRQVKKSINGQELKRASAEWEKIRTEIPNDTLNNQQCIARYDTIVEWCNKKVNIQEYISKMEEALRITMPEFEKIDIKNWPLSRNEIILLVTIASAYCDTGRNEEAKHIYYSLWNSIEESAEGRIYQITKYKLLAYNMGLLEGIEGNYNKAKTILRCGIENCMMAGRFEMIASFLYCLGWILREEDKDGNDEKARHIIKQAFSLGNILKLPNLCDEICNYYEEEWNSRITY